MVLFHVLRCSAPLHEKTRALVCQNSSRTDFPYAIAIPMASIYFVPATLHVFSLMMHTSFIKNCSGQIYATYTHYMHHLLQSCKTMPTTLKKSSRDVIIHYCPLVWNSPSIGSCRSLKIDASLRQSPRPCLLQGCTIHTSILHHAPTPNKGCSRDCNPKITQARSQ